MEGKLYQAKDRKVAKMERTGLVEENVRTGEKSRTSKESTREITFEGRADSGKREEPAVQNTFVSSSRSSSRNTGSRRFHRSRDLREREADGFGKQEPFKSYSNALFPEKEDTGESLYLGDQKENGSRQEDYTNIRNNRPESAEPGETSNNRDHSENSNNKERTRNRRKAVEKYREQDPVSRERPYGFPDKYGAGINSAPPDIHLPGISSEDLHRKIRKDQVRQGFQNVQGAQEQGFSPSGEDIKPGTGSHSRSTGNTAPGAEIGTEELSGSLQKPKLMFGDESSGMVRGAGMAMADRAVGRLAYPYVWGGSSPSTSFGCSGFVCWVINHCGNGWSVPRTTADGLRSYCSYVLPEEARPGDLVFFQNTYNALGATHVGIYVGEGMMIHCGEPIQYTSIESTYWRAHFLAFGRIH